MRLQIPPRGPILEIELIREVHRQIFRKSVNNPQWISVRDNKRVTHGAQGGINDWMDRFIISVSGEYPAFLVEAFCKFRDEVHAKIRHIAWTDQFRFGHFMAGQNGWVQTFGGPLMGMDDDIPRQQAAAAFGNPTSFSLVFDQPLLDRLFRAWRQCYLKNGNRKKLLRLFRALEVAFHASLFPADGLTSINDVGTRIALWVSAFEVLCHPGGGVNKRHVQKVISDAPFSDKTLTSTRFTVSYGGNKFRATLPEALYDDLYWARNQFLHGMPVRRAVLHYRQSNDYAGLTDVAPALFNAALVSRLNSIGVTGAPMEFSKLTMKTMVR
jgi:hypothetical protein